MFKYLKNLYNRFKLWYSMTEIEKELEEEIIFWDTPRMSNDIYYVEDSIQIKYKTALIKLKSKVNELAQTKTKEEYDKVLKQVNDLMVFTYDDEYSRSNYKETLRKLIERKGQDIQTTKDKQEMVQERIHHFYDLQEHKQKRELSRQIRKLEQEGKVEEAKRLTKEWKEKYGRIN